MNKRIFPILIILSAGLFFAPKTYAAINSLSLVQDTLSTSRPSASAPLNANQAASATQATIIDNGSMFLASDSAVLKADTGETLNTVTVASMSAQIAGTPNTRVVYFTGTAANTHHAGDPLITATSAMHTVQFNTTTAIPVSGSITITFPALASNDATDVASPSASTFHLNGLTGTTNIKVWNATDNAEITGWASITGTDATVAGNSPNYVLTLNGSTSIGASKTIKVFLGCSAVSGGACSTQVPTIINPTKSAASGTADTWMLSVLTKDVTNGIDLDFGKMKIGTIESVQVTATVEPTFTFTITGLGNNTAINSGNTTGCGNTEVTNTGIPATSTSVDLGALGAGGINIAAQRINISTNGMNGYTLTATSSGHLVNPATGYFLNDSTTPTVMTAGTTWFGIHACGLDVTSATWGTGATGGGANAKYGWPTQTSALTLSSDATGPISGNASPGDGVVSVEYAATAASTFPAGTYSSVVTYVATPSF